MNRDAKGQFGWVAGNTTRPDWPLKRFRPLGRYASRVISTVTKRFDPNGPA